MLVTSSLGNVRGSIQAPNSAPCCSTPSQSVRWLCFCQSCTITFKYFSTSCVEQNHSKIIRAQTDARVIWIWCIRIEKDQWQWHLQQYQPNKNGHAFISAVIRFQHFRMCKQNVNRFAIYEGYKNLYAPWVHCGRNCIPNSQLEVFLFCFGSQTKIQLVLLSSCCINGILLGWKENLCSPFLSFIQEERADWLQIRLPNATNSKTRLRRRKEEMTNLMVAAIK